MVNAAMQKAFFAGVFSRAAPTYDQAGVEFFAPIGRALVDGVALRPGDRVLDVGCGRGSSLFPAADAVGATGSVTGVDLAPGMVEETANEIARRGLTNATVRLGDAEGPEFPAASFDVVLAGLIIFFLPDPRAAAANYATLLRPGGTVALSTFVDVGEDEHRRKRVAQAAIMPYLPEALSTENGPDTSMRTRESLAELLDGAGFTDVAFAEFPHHVQFTEPEAYWRWNWSQGMRALLELVPTDRLEDAREAFLAASEGLRGADGFISFDYQFRLTTARNPVEPVRVARTRA